MKFTREQYLADLHEHTRGRYRDLLGALAEWRLGVMIVRIYAWGAVVWVADRVRPMRQSR